METRCGAAQATDDSMADMHYRCIPKATNTLSEYVILIAFPLQQWLHERAELLRYTCIACHFQTNSFLVEIPGCYSVVAEGPPPRDITLCRWVTSSRRSEGSGSSSPRRLSLDSLTLFLYCWALRTKAAR